MTQVMRSKNTSRTQPTEEPVCVADVKNDLNIDFGDSDGLIRGKIKVATQYIEEQILWRALLTQTCVDKLDTLAGQIELHWTPVASITSITYTDGDGDTQTLSTDTYELGTVNGLGVVRLKYEQSWPSVRAHPDTVTITYVAGYGDPEDVPVSIREAIRLYAGELFLCTESSEASFPLAADSLLSGQSAARILS